MEAALKLLKVGEVAEFVGISKAQIWALSAAGDFPSPIKLSPRATRWRAGEVAEWIESRPRNQSAA